MNILAFDLGASGGKLFLAAVGNGKASIQNIHRFDNVSYQINGSLYWDIINIYKEMNIGIKKAIELTDDHIDSFAIDSFSNDFAFIDEKGALLTPVRCYRDKRTERHAAKIYGRLSKEQLYSLSGNQNALFNTYMQLAAMCEDGHGYILKNAYKLLFIPDLLINFLTGKTISEYTLSSVSQLYDFKKDDWCQEILDSYSIPRSLFGTLTKPGTLLGCTQESYNKYMETKGFPVSVVCEHDTASAYLSSPVTSDCALISCGTWALIGTELDSCVITEEGYRANLANEGGYKGHHRLLRNVMSSWFIQETKRYYKEHGHDYSFEELGRLAEAAKPFSFLFDPDENLFYEPGNMPVKIQQYCMDHYGTRPESTGEIIRCIYESLAMKFRWTIEQLEHISQKPLPVINMMGGGAKASMLCQFTANAAGRKVIAGPDEATAIGNITVQLIATGAAATLNEAKDIMRPSYQTKEYTPQNTEEWNMHYEAFLKLSNDSEPASL